MNIGQYVRNHALRKFAKRKIKKAFVNLFFEITPTILSNMVGKNDQKISKKVSQYKGRRFIKYWKFHAFLTLPSDYEEHGDLIDFFYREDSEQIELPPATALTWKNNCYK